MGAEHETEGGGTATTGGLPVCAPTQRVAAVPSLRKQSLRPSMFMNTQHKEVIEYLGK